MSETESSTPPKKIQFYEQIYCPSCENKSTFKGWLSRSSKDVHFFFIEKAVEVIEKEVDQKSIDILKQVNI